ncbi:Fungalysin metallopeptidase-domain-containing protein [Auriculariales sp. MPI-PUGE-AT-0066]|nr:Fungalysin metallopeptidase-domain-containing protein [Auriculariales sp. MPI-PUGE-AT-0066]
MHALTVLIVHWRHGDILSCIEDVSDDLVVATAVAHSTLNSTAKIFASSSSFVTPQAATEATISTDAAISAVKSGATRTGKDVGLEYFQHLDASGTDNADMTTPADGSPGKMRMFLWDITNLDRDGALVNDIFLHEYTHSTRTGSRAVAPASMPQTADTISDYTTGSFGVNDAKGIRSHPYSTSKTVNPYTYATLATKNEVHDIGEIWANMLINVYAALVGTSEFDVNAHSDASLTTGNAVWLHLFIDALALQLCTPTFITARDAWIQADKNRYNGANACTLWTAFASRGLGQGATSARKDNADVPAECSGGGTGQPPAPTTTTSDVPEPTATTTTSDDEPAPTETSDPTDPQDPENHEHPQDPLRVHRLVVFQAMSDTCTSHTPGRHALFLSNRVFL